MYSSSTPDRIVIIHSTHTHTLTLRVHFQVLRSSEERRVSRYINVKTNIKPRYCDGRGRCSSVLFLLNVRLFAKSLGLLQYHSVFFPSFSKTFPTTPQPFPLFHTQPCTTHDSVLLCTAVLSSRARYPRPTIPCEPLQSQLDRSTRVRPEIGKFYHTTCMITKCVQYFFAPIASNTSCHHNITFYHVRVPLSS